MKGEPYGSTLGIIDSDPAKTLPRAARDPTPAPGPATPAVPTPPILPQLWYLGALLVCLGGYWVWVFIRGDVAAGGNSPFRIVGADLFLLSLVASAATPSVAIRLAFLSALA